MNQDDPKKRLEISAYNQTIQGKAELRFTPHDVDTTVKALEAALSKHSDVYSKNQKLVMVDSDGKITPLTDPTLIRLMTQNVCFTAMKESGRTMAKLPTERVINALLQAGKWPAIRSLRRTSKVPVLLASGELLTSGYRDEILVLGDHEPAPRNRPIAKPEAAKAAHLLLEVIRDFPLDDHGKSAWLATLLSLVGRELICGNIPLLAYDGNQPGIGKTLLVSLACEIAFGGKPHTMTRPRGDEECTKAYYSAAATGAECILLDNVHPERELADETLEMALTSGTFSKRGLGTDSTITTENRSVWIATGNGLQLGSDMSRRCIQIQLRTPCEAPSTRELPDVALNVKSRRAELFNAAVTILQSWQQAKLRTSHAFGSFEDWAQVVDGAITHAGLPSVVSHQRTIRKSNDSGRDALTGFLNLLATFPDKQATSAQLCAEYPWQSTPDDTAKRYEGRAVLEAIAGRNYSARSVGKHLRGMVGRIIGDMSLGSRKNRDDATIWHVGTLPLSTGSAGFAGFAVDSSSLAKNSIPPQPLETAHDYMSAPPNPTGRGSMNGGAQ